MAYAESTDNGRGKQVVDQFGQLQAARAPLDTEYRECYQYTKPSLGAGFAHTTSADGMQNAVGAKALQSKLMDSTSSNALRMLASSILSSLTPPNTPWFDLADSSRFEDDLDSESKEWLKTSGTRLHSLIHSSNYDCEAMTFVEHIVIAGMCGLYVEEKDGDLHFEVWPLNHLYVQETLNRGYIDTVYREFHYTPQQAVIEFGLNALPQKIQDEYKDKPHSTNLHRFIVAIRPRIKNGKQATGSSKRKLPWESLWVSECGTIVRESGFHEMPVIVSRWQTIPDTDYARGPVSDALPDIKSLNKVQELMLMSTEMHVAPMIKVKDDGVINPHTIRMGPRNVIPVGDMDNLQTLTAGGDVSVAVNQIAAYRSNVNQMLLADKLSFAGIAGIQTATEVQTRNNQVRQILGPIFARTQSEYLTQLIERCFGLALRAGLFHEIPDGLRGREFEIDYRSPLARSQKMQEVEQIDEFTKRVQIFAELKPEVMDLLDVDGAVRILAAQLGIDPAMLNDVDAVKIIRKNRADAQAAAVKAEQEALAQQQAAQQQPPKGMFE